jgi:hypothetical protein
MRHAPLLEQGLDGAKALQRLVAVKILRRRFLGSIAFRKNTGLF